MSQLNNNVKGNGNTVAEELRALSLEQKEMERRDKQIRFSCSHKDTNGRSTVRTTEDGYYVCKICNTRINAKVSSLLEVNRKVREVIELIEAIKLAGDQSITPALAKIEEGVDSINSLYEKVVLKAGNKKQNNHNNNGGNQRRAVYKTSKL